MTVKKNKDVKLIGFHKVLKRELAHWYCDALYSEKIQIQKKNKSCARGQKKLKNNIIQF